MDLLSEVLSLLRLREYISGGFVIANQVGLSFPGHSGIKCYAIGSGSCWLAMEDESEGLALNAGDCLLLPHGIPFTLTTDLGNRRIPFSREVTIRAGEDDLPQKDGMCLVIGAHFILDGDHAKTLLSALPRIVHIQRKADKEVIRWSLERMKTEFENPQPGGALMGRELAYIMLLQAVRLHVRHEAQQGVGWLFGLVDPQMRKAIQCMHDRPEHSWSLQELADHLGMSRTAFAERFRRKVGITPIAYLSRWRLLLAANRLRNSDDSISEICSSLGYGSESAFGRAFRSEWGCSPRKLRRRKP